MINTGMCVRGLWKAEKHYISACTLIRLSLRMWLGLKAKWRTLCCPSQSILKFRGHLLSGL